METRAFCKECFDAWENQGVAKEEIARRVENFWQPITPDLIQKWQCHEGHTNYAWLSAPFYDLLYSKALTDLARLDTRSAVLNFFSAWENFVSDTVNLLLHDAGTPSPSTLNRSEPRLGMYVGLYAARNHELPFLPKDDATRMVRNKIVHDNKIPTEDEALKVANDIRGGIIMAIEKLHPLHLDHTMGLERQQEAVKKAGLAPHNVQFVFMRSQVQDDIEQKIQLIRQEQRRL